MQESIKKFEEKMTKSIDVLLEEYASIRAGRANPHVLDRIKVEYYGTPTPIQQVGNISVPEHLPVFLQLLFLRFFYRVMLYRAVTHCLSCRQVNWPL